MNQTHYQTLGVSETAPQAEIKRVYRRFARKYHPDRNATKSDEEKFKEITAAYFVIGDPGRRQTYDYDLRQARKAGAASGSSSAGASAPPAGQPPPSSSGAGAQATPPPPAQGAYRYLFFRRGLLVGSAAVAAILTLALISYVACRRSPATPMSNAAPPGPVSAAKTQKEPAPFSVSLKSVPLVSEPTAAIPDPTPTTAEPTPSPEPARPTPTPTPVTPEPTLPASDPTPAPPPIHLCGKWRGSFEWLGTTIPFAMRLEQRGNEISGVWTEGRGGRIWRATIRGFVTGSTVTLVKTYVDTDSTVSLVSSDSSSEFLRGTWETPQNRGAWEAALETEVVDSVSDHPREAYWRQRPSPPSRSHSKELCWYGWRRTPDGNRVRCNER